MRTKKSHPRFELKRLARAQAARRSVFAARETARSSSLARGLGLVGSSESGDTSLDGLKERKRREKGETVEKTFALTNTFVEFAISIFHHFLFAGFIFDSILSNVDRILLGKKMLRFVTGRGNQTLLNIQKGR